jgi:DnaJ-domain-containing protein 1
VHRTARPIRQSECHRYEPPIFNVSSHLPITRSDEEIDECLPDVFLFLANDCALDYYKVLQISPNAEPETVHRVYRLLAQRLHPDKTIGGISRFQGIPCGPLL